MNSQAPDAQPPAPQVPAVDVMESLGLRVQLSFPDFLALSPEDATGESA